MPRDIRLEPLIAPRSVAVLGASERPSLGRSIVDALTKLGFPGAIYPINPRYPELNGRRCYASLDELPEAPDVVAFCIGYPRILENFQRLAARGAGAAVIYDGGFAERGDEGRTLQAAIVGLSREAGIALCGPNCMGVLNPYARATTYMQDVRDPSVLAGNVGLVSQSGSICIGLLSDLRRFAYSLVVSAGNEAVLSTAAYLEHLIDDPNTKVIATFTETVREPERYVAALDRAADQGKPVVVLKVGRSDRARRAITTHTGGLAGESRVFSELLRAHRAIEVTDLDELTEVLAVCQGMRWPTGRRLAVVTASGGQAELILDVGTAAGLELPPLPAPVRAEVERVIGSITGDGNPLDMWGNGDYKTNLPHALTALDGNAETDTIVYCSDSFDNVALGRAERALDNVRLLAAAAQKSAKPHFLMSTRSGVVNREQVNALAEIGVVVIGGTRQGLGAIDRMARWAAPLPPLRAPRRIGQRLDGRTRKSIHEHDAKQLLASWGAPVSRERLVGTLDAACAAAREIGYPVVLKLVSDDVPHKSEHGLVKVGLADEAALGVAWHDLEARVQAFGKPIDVAGYLVQEMVSDGIEVFAGIARDPDFGLSIAFGLGGIEIELLGDFAMRTLPLRQGEAAAMIGEIRGAARLGPVRGRPPADVASLAACIEALADFAEAHRDSIAEIDLNPIKVRPQGQGCVIVDALIVTRKE
ncbi:MAG: acetate--CoA ligase family protein [Proteobacteria bacterium]|nr:acetate--CoA ligase family protein [Pseudomonadota bacterium]